MIPCRHFNTPAGYWTDDGAMALGIMESAVRCQRYDLKDIADNFIRWYDDGFCSSMDYSFDVGTATVMGIHGLKRGELRNGFEGSQGNGSIMRFAPSLLLDNGDNRVIHEVSDLTHDSCKVRETIDLMAEICRTHLSGVKTTFRSEYSMREEVNNSGWAVSTLQAALWAFQTADSFEEALIAAVNLGGDADTIGAVCGQIAGAYYGYSAIPERWLAAVKDREKLDNLINDFIAVCKKIANFS
jgi:ADP-ribosyl-[dinitrogen reductase] hydrolase